ncbi:MAG: hypothetical protein LBT59_13055 [Clostridiales bacterium]|nr:hypothetical protein [Clostridiales bacterium]
MEKIVASEAYIQTMIAVNRKLFGEVDEAEERRMLQIKIDVAVENADKMGISRETLIKALDPKLLLQRLPELEAQVKKWKDEGSI